HPFGAASPFFNSLPLGRFGLAWIEPPVQLAHPFDADRAGLIYRDLDRTARELWRDGARYRRVIGRIVRNWTRLEAAIMGPPRLPRHTWTMGWFGLHALRSFEREARLFRTERTRALLAGIAAHGMLPLERRPTA